MSPIRNRAPFVSSAPNGFATDDDIYVSNFGSNSLTVVSGVTNGVVATVPVGCGPDAIGTASPNNTPTPPVLVANSCSGTISVLKPTGYTLTNDYLAASGFTLNGTIVVGSDPVALNLVNEWGNSEVTESAIFDVANFGSGTVTEINATFLPFYPIFTVPAGSGPSSMSSLDMPYESVLPNILVTDSTSNSTTVIGPAVLGSYNQLNGGYITYDYPSILAVANGLLYVGNNNLGSISWGVSVFNASTNKIVGTIPADCYSLVYDPNNGYLYGDCNPTQYVSLPIIHFSNRSKNKCDRVNNTVACWFRGWRYAIRSSER